MWQINKLSDISAELSVSVLSGLFSLKGSGKYTHDLKQNSRTRRLYFIYEIETQNTHYHCLMMT